MPITAIIALIIQLLPEILSVIGVITPNMSKLIEQLGAAIPALITSLVSGGGVPDKVASILAALQAELEVMKQDTTLPTNTLQMIETVSAGITDALAAYEQAKLVTDPTTLKPLPEDLTPTS